MITKENIIQILQNHSYNVEYPDGNHLIVVDDNGWEKVAEQCVLHIVSNCTSCNAEINYKGICEICYTERHE